MDGAIADKKGDVIKTMWLMTHDVPDDEEPEWPWYSNRVGADEFRRSEPPRARNRDKTAETIRKPP